MHTVMLSDVGGGEGRGVRGEEGRMDGRPLRPLPQSKLTRSATCSRHEPHPEILIKVCASSDRKNEAVNTNAAQKDAVACNSGRIYKTMKLNGLNC